MDLSKPEAGRTKASTDVARDRLSGSLSGGRYQLLGQLGAGGMASVFIAHDRDLDIERAVKILNTDLEERSNIRERFVLEARTMARLHHPHIVAVHDVGYDRGHSFFVMELLEGGSLQTLLDQRTRLPVPRAIDVVDQVLTALAHAHGRGVVHRDIKPANVLLAMDGAVKVTDFGIARVENDRTSLTRAGSAMGTLAYMAPEQRTDAHSVDARADIYAVGATLYQLITGREPFDLYSTEGFQRLFAGYPPELIDVTVRACRYRAEDRFSSADEMKRALEAARSKVKAVDGLDLIGTTGPREPSPNSMPAPSTSPYATFDDSLFADDDPPSRSGSTLSPASLAPDVSAPTDDDPGAAARLERTMADPRPVALAEGTLLPTAKRRFPAPAWAALPMVLAIGIAAWLVGPWSDAGGDVRNVAEPSGTQASTPTQAPAGASTESTAAGESGAALPLSAPAAATTAGALGDDAPAPPQTSGGAAEAAQRTARVRPPPLNAGSRPEPASSGPAAAAATAATAATAAATAATTTAVPTNAATPRDVAPPAASPATLFVNSHPYTSLILDGTPLGETDWQGDLTSGSHTLVLTTSDGRRREVSLQLEPGSTREYCWDFDLEATCAR